MQKIEFLDKNEMLEDLTAMLKTEEDYKNTFEMLNLNEEQIMIFKRAAFHIRRNDPNPLVIKRAYQILIAKSFHNTKRTSHDDQNILAKKQIKNFSLIPLFNSHLPKIIIGIFLIIILKSFF